MGNFTVHVWTCTVMEARVGLGQSLADLNLCLCQKAAFILSFDALSLFDVTVTSRINNPENIPPFFVLICSDEDSRKIVLIDLSNMD